MKFASREDAGRDLGHWLQDHSQDPDVVVGLPRGGVVVAAAVAEVLSRPLTVLIVRKIGHPAQREFAVGAIAEGGVILLDRRSIDFELRSRAKLEQIIQEERQRLHDYELKFRGTSPLAVAGKSVLIVDDGLATGATTEAAVLSAKKLGARSVVVSAPIASTHAVERLKSVADAVSVLDVDPYFEAVGGYYESFPQTTDEEVLALLSASAPRN